MKEIIKECIDLEKKLEQRELELNEIMIERNNLLDRLDKAIEYCEEITSRALDISDTDYELGQDFTARDILDILGGKDNEL